jgi:hypothetical protein
MAADAIGGYAGFLISGSSLAGLQRDVASQLADPLGMSLTGLKKHIWNPSPRFRYAVGEVPSSCAPMTRTKSTRIVIVLAAVVAMTAVPSGRPASALLTKDVPIQPGAPMIAEGSYFQGAFCTLNFVFKDKKKKNPKTYIGTADGCTSGVARSPEIGAFGTVVYTQDESTEPAPYPYGLGDTTGARFALIQIDRNKLKYVSRVVRGFGAPPSGYTTSRTTNAGDPLITHGYPAFGAVHQAVTRFGVLGGDTSTRYWSSIQPNIQDRGSPVIRADGMAVGMSDEESSFWATWLPESPPIARFPTVEGLLRQLRSAGFNVTL